MDAKQMLRLIRVAVDEADHQNHSAVSGSADPDGHENGSVSCVEVLMLLKEAQVTKEVRVPNRPPCPP
jgi:hypothetical protein